MKNKQEIHLGFGSHLNVQTSRNVSLYETLTLINGDKDPITLDIKVEADFNTIPEQYHEVFFNMMASNYYNKASFGDNPFSQCLPPAKKKWYQFWKVR